MAATRKVQFKAALVTHPGFEDVAATELSELIGAKAKTAAPGIVAFQVKELAGLCRLCYLSQSASAILFLFSEFSVEKTAARTAENMRKSLRNAGFSLWFSKGTTFKVSFESLSSVTGSDSDSGSDPDSGADSLLSSELEAEFGSVIIESVKASTGIVPKVDLESPAITIAVYMSGSKAFCGIRLGGFDLSKREYRVFGHSSDIKGTLAYLLLRSADYSPGQSLFDPFTRSGTIAVEAAFFSSGFPVNYYRKDVLSSAFSRLLPFAGINFTAFFAAAEKEAAASAKKQAKGKKAEILSSSSLMQNLRSAEKNAKIAGVNKLIRFSRLDVEWLDAKVDEKSIGLVVSYPPQFKSANSRDSFAAAENTRLAKLYKEFFYQAVFFLRKGGEVVLLLREGSAEAAAAASSHKFKPTVLRKFLVGSSGFELVSFSR